VEAMETGEHAIRAVIFDLWGTLLFENDGASVRRAYARCRNLTQALNNLGVQISFEEISVAVKETVSSLMTMWDTNRDIGYIDQIRLIIMKLSRESLDLRQEWMNELVSAYTSSILEVPPYLNPEARKALEDLKKHHKLIGLICNTGLTPGIGLRKLLANESVSRYFDLMIFSEEIGIRKPDPSIFHLAAHRLDVQPTEIVHVGDSLKMDVWGAKNAGLTAIHFLSQEGRDRIAESDPNSLVSLSRKLGNLRGLRIVPDIEIRSLAVLMEAIEELERDRQQ
jgi:putative hydrolase of the HAD superfamily